MRALSGVWVLFFSVSLLLACGDDDSGSDAGLDASAPDAQADVDTTPECFAPEVLWGSGRVDTVVGITREVRLELARDFCRDATVAIAAATDGVVRTVSSVTIPAHQSRVLVAIEPLAIGETTLTATYTAFPGEANEERFSASLEVFVVDTDVPSCEGSASGRLDPGDELATGSARLELPEGAARDDEFHVDGFDASLGCAPDQVPEGYRALGPAIAFGPAHLRFNRELPMSVPVKLALLPEHATRGHVQFSYTGPGVTTPRIVPVASPDYESSPGFVRFYAPRLGTYQAVTRELGPQPRERTFTFRGITGVSMGAAGSALIGMHNPDRFDFVGPLGGPVDWIHMTNYMRTYHLGGFCTQAERDADPAACEAGADVSRTPPNDGRLFEVRQDFEHWYYEDDWKGHGGTFDRKEYIRIFRDLAMMFGNPNTTRTEDPLGADVTPPGIPDSERTRPDADRCANPVRIPPCEPEAGGCAAGTGFFDDEYNPVGQHPLITFCDGGELRVGGDRDIGVWDPSQPQTHPFEVALAVDINDNGVRDPGEPVVRQGREPFEDCGLDQLCDPEEPGYDPITNPDPNGDDYDFQYNPMGTEGNWLRDYTGPAVGGCASPEENPAPGVGERFRDVGLDGVAGTAQLSDGGFDTGEGDGCWTRARGLVHLLANNPRGFVLDAEEDTLRDLDFFSDGGIRDLFNFATNHNQLAGAFSARGLPLNLYNSHAALSYDGSFLDEDFRFNDVDWSEIGKYVHIRYGNVDATQGAIVQGDGQHVGAPTQIANRILSVMAWMSSRWPGGDRRRVVDRLCPEVGPGCPERNQFSFDFTSPTTGRTGPAAIVLPPGYFDEEYQDVEYPVVYLLHGYGQQPQDLVATGIIIWNFMNSNRLPEANRFQKMIFVFPDGRCRNGECVKGTFYADAVPGTPDGAQMETFMLDLMDYIDANYRTKSSETHLVYE